jgi:hypothetical protein
MGEILGRCEKYLEIGWFGSGGTSSRIRGFSGGFRGFRRETELLPNGDVADGGTLADASWFCRRAVARAAAGVPKRRVTTLAAGQSPDLSRSSASHLRLRACVRDQS